MNIYQAAGELMIGSRLKRLGERLFSEVGRVYRELGIPFEPSWFPLFFLLDRRASLPVTALAREMGVTNSAASQLVEQVKRRKLVKVGAESRDRRVRTITLSPTGQALLEQARAVWQALSGALAEMEAGPKELAQMLQLIEELENSLAGESLAERVKRRLHKPLESRTAGADDLNQILHWQGSATATEIMPIPLRELRSIESRALQSGLVWVCRQGSAIRGVLAVAEKNPGDQIVCLQLDRWYPEVALSLFSTWSRKRSKRAWLTATLSPHEGVWAARLQELGFHPERLLEATKPGGHKLLEWRRSRIK